MSLIGTGFFLPAVLIASYVIGRIGIAAARFLLLISISSVGALPSLISPAFPFNYVPVLLMIVAGLSFSRPQSLQVCFKQNHARRYLLWLSIMVIGIVILLLRWSTLGEEARRLFPDLSTSPTGDRVSFSLLFPILTLSLYGLAPLVSGLKKTLKISTKNFYRPLVCGFFISASLAGLQHFFKLTLLSRPGWIEKGHSNGAFSDFNGLGLVSGFIFFLSLLYLTENHSQPLRKHEKTLASAALMLSLFCAYWSKSRTALLVFFLAIIWLLVSYRSRIFKRSSRWLWISSALLALFALFLIPGMSRSILDTIHPRKGQDWTTHIDRLSNGRLLMLSDGLETINRFPVSGIGPGNFLFYQRYKHYQSDFLHDLPLNQFLLISIEGGLLSLALFLFWFWGVWQHTSSRWRWLIGAFALSFLVGTPLWLPEGVVLFWLIIALGQEEPTLSRKRRVGSQIAAFLIIGAYLTFNLQDFKALDPSSWQAEKNLLNSYGFWNADPGMEGIFRWTQKESGYYIDGKTTASPKIYCGAPLHRLPDKKQTIFVFWRGKPLKKMIFTENIRREILLPQNEAGWLEFLVEPVFNLREMKLGPETRTLGVQIHFN